MKSFIIVFAIMAIFLGCVRKNKVPVAQIPENPAMHEVKVSEVIQTTQYTYLKVNENGTENWIAVTRMEATPGETYYYDKEMEMNNFESKELKRTFEKIYFVSEISKEPIAAAGSMPTMQPTANHTGKISVEKKEGISVAAPQGGISIAQLWADREKYAGQVVKVKGQVVKINEMVMGKNWIHIQDGSGTTGDYDLAVTTLDGMKMDDIVTFEGTVTLSKDFGAGYFYELIMEDAKLIQ